MTIMRIWKIALGVCLIAYLLTGVVQVRPGERLVVRRFGRVLAEKPEPGLWIGLPWGMDQVDRVAVDRVQSIVVGYQEDLAGSSFDIMPAGQLITGDHNLVNIQAVLYYKVDPDLVEEHVAELDNVEPLLARAVETVMGEWVASRDVDHVLLNGKNELPSVLVHRVQAVIGTSHLGLQVVDARIGSLAPPEEVKAAFDNVALQQTKVETLRQQTERDREMRLSLTQGEKYNTEQTAAAYAHSQQLLAEGDANRFLKRLEQYVRGAQQNPQYLRQIWEEERGRLFTKLKENNQIDLLDHHLGPDGLDILTMPPRPQK
jgi:membrane protease subunit HflK